METNPHPLLVRLARALWQVVWVLVFRPSPYFCFGWRRFLLRCFGANVAPEARIYPSVKIWAPWNLSIGEYSTIGPNSNFYCVSRIEIGSHTAISQYSFFCTATHDYEKEGRPLIARPIVIGSGVWICVDVYIGLGVRVGDGAVVGARASVYKDVEPWTVVGGNPAKFIKMRSRPGSQR